MSALKYAILITTKNRLEDLKVTLNNISYLINNKNVGFIICDDGSTDGTFQYLKDNYKQIQVIQNKTSKGLIFSRNRLLAITTADYAITLDDDAHIVSNNPLEIIESFFLKHPKCAVVASRIFWGKDLPSDLTETSNNTRVKGFVGCGHVWRMAAWRSIPNYPDWFVFYGEEEFASYHKKTLEKESTFLPQLKLYLESVPFEIVNTLQHNVSVNIILESNSEISPFLPGKFPHCVFADKPILALGPKNSEVRRLLGEDYPYLALLGEEKEISNKIQALYFNWKSNKHQMLDDKNLLEYLSIGYLKSKLEKIIS